MNPSLQDIRPGPKTLDADFVLTMDGPAIRKGRVATDADRIIAVGPAADVQIVGQHIDLGRSVLMPGLINAHCHLELSAYHGALPASDLWTWLAGLVMLRMQSGADETERAAVPAAVRSMIESGTTCVGDISRAAWLPRILATLPIRKVCYVELISGALSPPADMMQLRQRLGELPTDDPLLIPAISPHAPYTVTTEDLRDCAELVWREELPLAIHLAETTDEVEWLRGSTGRIADWHRRLFKDPPSSPAMGPAEYVMSLRLAGRETGANCVALIHMNYPDDWHRLCEMSPAHRPAVVFCPRCHRFFAHSPHRFREMLAAGLAVAIGTDSAASHFAKEARPLSVLDELRWLHRNDPDIPAEMLLKMATIHGAKALGQSESVGRIAPGLLADLIAFGVSEQGNEDPAAGVVRQEEAPILVLIGGKNVPPTRRAHS